MKIDSYQKPFLLLSINILKEQMKTDITSGGVTQVTDRPGSHFLEFRIRIRLELEFELEFKFRQEMTKILFTSSVLVSLHRVLKIDAMTCCDTL